MSLANFKLVILDPIDRISDFVTVINTWIAVYLHSHGDIFLLQMGSLVFLEFPVFLLPVIVKILVHTSQGCIQVVNLIRSPVVRIQIKKWFAPYFSLQLVFEYTQASVALKMVNKIL